MPLTLSKTDFLIYKDCEKNAWVKIHKPEVYKSKPLSVFDQGLLQMGNEVDILARELFPQGLYQQTFATDKFKSICDILVSNEDGTSDLYEVKASNSGEDKKAKDELYTYDLAFQYNVMRELGVPPRKTFLIRMNKEYVREETLDIEKLFTKEDFTERVKALAETVKEEMSLAYDILSSEKEPPGHCRCITRGRSAHCTTFSYSNPDVPDYSVHDISRIGNSKRKLEELVDSGVFSFMDIPADFPLSDKQWNQVKASQTGRSVIMREEIREFLEKIVFPISFFDYETFAAAIPRFDGYSPFKHIPFQFSLHVLETPEAEPLHKEFLYLEKDKPDQALIEFLRESLPEKGSVIVWSQKFEKGINSELAKRNPERAAFLESVSARIVDLMDIFSDQLYVHPDFKGKASIKFILPVLVPSLSYKELNIQEGATAMNTWDKIVTGQLSLKEAQEAAANLREYCKLDTYAMYAIWKELHQLVS
jgi:hypothetical protein